MPPTAPSHPSPPTFVMWSELPTDESRTWERQWFGHELTPEAAFNIRGIGIRDEDKQHIAIVEISRSIRARFMAKWPVRQPGIRPLAWTLSG